MADPTSSSRIGAVIIGRNEGERLRRCLASLTPSAVPLVYVDSASTDGSVATATAAGADVVALDLGCPFTAARARNEGFARLVERHPAVVYVQFVDGDCEVESEWIDSASRFLDAEPEFAVVCGRRRERFPEASFYNRLCDAEWNTAIGEAESAGGDAMMRVESLREVGGFDPAMIAHEEPELCARLRIRGYRVCRLDAPMTVHDANIMSLGPWLKRNRRAGYGYAQAYLRNPGLMSKEFRLLARAGLWTTMVAAILLLLVIGQPLAAGLVGMVVALHLARNAIASVRAGHDRPALRSGLGLLAKLAEFAGALQFASDLVQRRAGQPIYYR